MKHVHKHIGRRLKRYAGHYTRYLLKRDTIFATIFCLVLLVLLGMIPFNFYAINPLKIALKDFDFNDIAYAKGKRKADSMDKRIVVINIGHAGREELAYIIEKTASFQPKVIGLDAYFVGERDPKGDSTLRSVFEKTDNLITASRLARSDSGLVVIPEYFDSSTKTRGSVHLIGYEVGTIRFYAPFEKVGHKKYPHFSTAIANVYDSTARLKLEKRHKQVETINYLRRVDQYKIIEVDDLMTDNVEASFLKDKIVLLGYINPDPNDIEDKQFTPMNAQYIGKSKPDMNGVIVQANIISMVLDGNYIKKMPIWFAWLVAIIIGWIHMSLFVRYYLDDHIWFHLVAKIAQIASAFFFTYLGIYVFDKFDIRIDMKYTLYVIVLSVDIIYFYEALAVWMHKKFHFRTLFHQHHHGH
jgi:CHASE2 domain-containing sensor protein